MRKILCVSSFHRHPVLFLKPTHILTNMFSAPSRNF